MARQEKDIIERFEKSLKLHITAKQVVHGRVFDANLKLSPERTKKRPAAVKGKRQ
ncbi:hypothetical protein HA075_11935 [bacterium BFN5]|nr:hypothetical protein HA075_11935 [bacterium BFN5]